MSLTPAGPVTAKILQFNLSERILEREQLIQMGAYPPISDSSQ
jgi:hypothetical protein